VVHGYSFRGLDTSTVRRIGTFRTSGGHGEARPLPWLGLDESNVGPLSRPYPAIASGDHGRFTQLHRLLVEPDALEHLAYVRREDRGLDRVHALAVHPRVSTHARAHVLPQDG